ncbi:hypothetical protein M422DRAFT_191249, partial [Sphaerobolus stellatus SS14]
RTTICNGRADLCNRSYGNVTFIGAHDSFTFSSDPLALARTQTEDLTSQLESGVRLLQAQSHMSNGVLHFCHTSCLLFDGGTVANYLTTVKQFLDKNPNEVLTLLFTNPEGVSVSTIWDPIFNSTGMSELAYVPPSIPAKQSEWPTLSEMIQSGKRVVVFMDFNTNTSAVPYILPEFEMVWETPFDVVNSSFPCSIDRISGPLADEDHMNLLNHFLDIQFPFNITIPYEVAANTTNSVSSILNESRGCLPLNGGRNPNFILIDWVSIGNATGAANLLNSGIINGDASFRAQTFWSLAWMVMIWSWWTVLTQTSS